MKKHELIANLSTGKMKAFGQEIDISCVVRNEVNGWRKKDQIVKSIPANRPIMPRQFPKGTWAISMPLPRDTPYLAPYFIPTDAWQFLPVWSLDGQGHYDKPTDTMTKDSGYGLHYSESNSTQGCIKIMTMTDLLWLVTRIKNALDAKERVVLTVI